MPHEDLKHTAILFIDDEEMALKYFNRAFSKDFWTMTCSSVDQAVELLEQDDNKIGIVITDQRMPEKTGVELLKYLRDNHPHIVRILTTAYSDLEDAINAVNKGEIFRYITKPWDIRNLRGDIISALNYYRIQRERDLLLNEKLSIWQRMSQTEKARDTIIMAGSLSHLKNGLHAIHTFLTQVPAPKITGFDFSQRNFDPWQAMQHDIQHQIETATRITNATMEGSGHPNEVVNLEQTVSEALAAHNGKYEGVELVQSAEGPLSPLKSNTTLIRQLLDLTLEYAGSHCLANNHVKLTIRNTDAIWTNQASSGATINIHYHVNDMNSEDSNTDNITLLKAILICYHLGGKVDFRQTANGDITFSLPHNPDEITPPPLHSNWLEEIFEAFESGDEF